ncbi:NAD binding domain of 6-phosphogluconate dehydrogenase-domain-containing protein [Elsinoe ampelina]|uniref:3-hydroxyisobutyrate dehydrogenase n=1 Tax=Elsinoe ampelina TaxID=302913 RepID=A0A6A6GMY5_9PEZI|nr:NAD binding domain of 6-phosphogluconate dehydrogenase-domain-containing protein [Elsinoe ampelina]
MAALRAVRQHASSFLAGPGSVRHFSSTRSAQAVYGFIGLGRMGYPMAGNLRAKLPSTDTLIVYDVNSDATSKFKSEHKGVEVAPSVRDIAVQSETIITVLPEPSHVKNVYMSMLKPPTLLSEGAAKPRLFIDCSTIDPMSSAEVANATHSSGQGKFVDAPMSGGVVGAQNAKLTFMIGASDSIVDRAREVLSMMGQRVLHLGPQTSGLKGKLANNYLLAINNIATAEAMNMGISWGLDAKALADMINISTGKCWPSEINNPVPGVVETAPASREYVGGFGTALMNKDLRLAMQAAQEHGVEPRLGPIAQEIYSSVEANPQLKGKDFSVVYKWLEGKN